MHDGAQTDNETADPLDRVADLVSVASDFGAIWVAVAVVQVLVGRAALGDATRRLACAGAASLVLTRVLKHHFAVPRATAPTAATLARDPSSSGFPSGHTLAAFTSATVLPRSVMGRCLGYGFASLVGWARVRVGHHRPEDVVAGAAAGTLVGAAASALLALGATSRP